MSAPGRLSVVLHTHMPYVEGFGTWPFGEEWLWEAIATLIARDHATVGSLRLFGHDIWQGWLMLAAPFSAGVNSSQVRTRVDFALSE